MTGTSNAYRVGISGSYGGLNLGDEAILECMVKRLKGSLPVEITVFSRNPEHTARLEYIDRAIGARVLSRDEILPEIDRLDLFILGGGGILFDGEAHVFLREVALAHERGVPVMTYAIGAGPLRDPESRSIVKRSLDRAAVITVRERNAKKTLEDAGIDEGIEVTADPALLLRPEPLPPHALQHEGISGMKRMVGISVREPGMAAPDLNVESYHDLLANVADYMIERFNADIVFVPMERKTSDLQHSHAVISRMLRPERATVIKGEYTPGQTLSLMKHFVFAVGMRLHFLIFAALQHVPFVALPYASKVSGFLDMLQLQSPPMHLVNAGRVIAHIDSLWDDREAVTRRIRRMLPQLQQQAARTNEIAVALLQRGGPAAARDREESHACT